MPGTGLGLTVLRISIISFGSVGVRNMKLGFLIVLD